MHRRKNYRKSVTTKLPASVGIATIGDVGTTGVSRGAMTGVTPAVVVAVVRGVVSSGRSAEAAAAEIVIVVSAVVAAVTVIAIAIPDLANCRSRRKVCA